MDLKLNSEGAQGGRFGGGRKKRRIGNGAPGRMRHSGTPSRAASFPQPSIGTIRSLEYTIQNLEETAAEAERSITEARKRVTDLTAQTGQPVEYADKLASLVRRQQEITDALDLTKTQASAQLEAETKDESSAVEPEGDARKGEHDAEWLSSEPPCLLHGLTVQRV